MKKILLNVIAVALAALTALSLSSCGSDSDRARGHVEKGDAIMAGVKARNEKMGGLMQALLESAAAAMNSGDAPDAAAFEKSASEIEASLDKEAGEADLAKAEYEKAEALEGAGAYREYAGLQLEVIDNALRSMEVLKVYLDRALGMVSSPGFDPAEFLRTANDLSSRMEKLGRNTTSLEEKADALRKQKGL